MSLAGGTTAHSVLTSHNKPVPTTPYSPAGGTTAHRVLTSLNKQQVIEHALALEDAGAFGIVLECVPAPVARAVTAALKVPTIGIGAGPYCSGQVLVYHDLLGVMEHPHYKAVSRAPPRPSVS